MIADIALQMLGNCLVEVVLQRRSESSRFKETVPGIDAFARRFNPQRKLLVGGQGIPVGEFLSVPVEAWLE